MKIFNEEEVKDYAVKKYQYLKDTPLDAFFYPKTTSFVEGVKYTESKVEDLCMEFAEYYYDNCDENPNYEFQFNKFLKERE